MIRPPAGPYATGILDQICECPLERGAVADHSHRLGDDVDVRSRGTERNLVETYRNLGRGCRLLPRESKQIVGEPREALGVDLEIGNQRRSCAVTSKMLDVATERRQRRPELVRSIGNKAPFTLASPLQAFEHRVQGQRQPADLVRPKRSRQPAARVRRPADLGRCTIEALQGSQRSAHEQGRAERTGDCNRERGKQRELVQRGDRVADF